MLHEQKSEAGDRGGVGRTGVGRCGCRLDEGREAKSGIWCRGTPEDEVFDRMGGKSRDPRSEVLGSSRRVNLEEPRQGRGLQVAPS